MKRRNFIKSATAVGLGLSSTIISPLFFACSNKEKNKMFFKISLAEWSLHRMLFDKKLTNLDFPQKAVQDFGIYAVEYVSVFFEGKESSDMYLKELKNRTENLGVRNVLIMVDREGNLGDMDTKTRKQAVKNHHKWVEVAKFLGCHSIRVNARGKGTADEVKEAAIEGLGRLSEYGRQHDINVIVENHGGYSSNGAWLADVISKVNNPFCGTLPDFGNFRIDKDKTYDRYKGVKEMMPFAKGVSAKSHDFDNLGNETSTDYVKMLQIVKDAGYKSYIGIEYEGSKLSEYEGILKTKALLEKVGKNL